MQAFLRISVVLVTGICLTGCGGNDSSAPAAPATTQATIPAQTQPGVAPASMPSTAEWALPPGVTPATEPAIGGTAASASNYLSDKKGPINVAVDKKARKLIAQVYSQIKANKISDAEATVELLHKLRHEKPVSDGIRFKEIPDAENAVLSAKADQAMRDALTQPATTQSALTQPALTQPSK